MRVEFIEKLGSWLGIKNACRNTINLDYSDKEPTTEWKRKLIMAEHSPLRKMIFSWKWVDLPYWVSVHFCRHSVGCTPFVSTQRDDRQSYTTGQTHTKRGDAPQSTPVSHEEFANAQAIINMSRKRLCNCASVETRNAWRAFLDEVVKQEEPELYAQCVRECVYRNGLCPEMKSCNFNKSDAFKQELKDYLEYHEDQICDNTNIFLHND